MKEQTSECMYSIEHEPAVHDRHRSVARGSSDAGVLNLKLGCSVDWPQAFFYCSAIVAAAVSCADGAVAPLCLQKCSPLWRCCC